MLGLVLELALVLGGLELAVGTMERRELEQGSVGLVLGLERA